MFARNAQHAAASSLSHARQPAAVLAALMCAGLAGVATPAQAQSAFSVEGPAISITDLGGGTGSIVCAGSPIEIPANAVLFTPVTRLTMSQLADPTPFPNAGVSPVTGLPRAGFVGGTCIVDGIRDDDTGVMTAASVSIDVAENVLVGAVTASPFLGNGPFSVVGVPVTMLTDPRLPSDKPAKGFYGPTGVHAGFTEQARNQYGYGIDPNTVGLPAPDLATAQGYLGSDGQFYTHTLDTTNGTLLRTDTRPTIFRAICKDSAKPNTDQIDVRGGCILTAGQTQNTVTLTGHNASGTAIQTYGTATCVADPLAPPFGSYRLVKTNLQFVTNACPASISVTLQGAAVDRRDFVGLQ